MPSREFVYWLPRGHMRAAPRAKERAAACALRAPAPAFALAFFCTPHLLRISDGRLGADPLLQWDNGSVAGKGTCRASGGAGRPEVTQRRARAHSALRAGPGRAGGRWR